LGVATLAVLALGSTRSGPAEATIVGPCEATIAGVDAKTRSASSASDAIPVEADAVITVTMSTPAGLESHDLDLEYAGITWTVSSETDDGDTSASDEILVADYADYGVGLYRVSGSARLADGSTCKGSVLVDVQGNPLTTAAGLAAAAMVGAGVAAVAGATIREAKRPKVVV
jgi:hypothetical protein